MGKIRSLLEHIKFEHTVFALPFAYLALLATRHADRMDLFWVTVAMVGARTIGMSANRLIDQKIDARNPRTRNRPLQRGTVHQGEAIVLLAAGILLLEGACLFLHPNTLLWSPVALTALIVYSFLKRWTWACHLGIGVTLGLAPLGATMAVTGSLSPSSLILAAGVLFWVTGFDILYTLLDIEFDRSEGLQSIPARWGIRPALGIARLSHTLSFLFLTLFGLVEGYRMPFWAALSGVGAILIWEHCVVRADDLSRVNQAFFTANGWIAVLILTACLLEILPGGAYATIAV